jgi:hypothetical protein
MAVEKCPDIPVTVVQYTFTHKQYTEQHIDTEQNIHNNINYGLKNVPLYKETMINYWIEYVKSKDTCAMFAEPPSRSSWVA